MKKPRKRTPAHRVNKSQRAAVIKRLMEVVADASSPAHAVTKAGAALLNADKPSRAGAADEPKGFDSDAPPSPAMILPDNGRNPIRFFGWDGTPGAVVIVPQGWPLEAHPPEHYAGVPLPIGVAAERAAIKARILAEKAETEHMAIIANGKTVFLPVRGDELEVRAKLGMIPQAAPFDESDPEIAETKRLCDAAGLPPQACQ